MIAYLFLHWCENSVLRFNICSYCTAFSYRDCPCWCKRLQRKDFTGLIVIFSVCQYYQVSVKTSHSSLLMYCALDRKWNYDWDCYPFLYTVPQFGLQRVIGQYNIKLNTVQMINWFRIIALPYCLYFSGCYRNLRRFRQSKISNLVKLF